MAGTAGGAPVVLGTPGENCPGYESPTDGDGLCRLDADCHGGGACDVWPEIVSGIDSDATPIPPAHECADDADCTSNRCAGVIEGPTNALVRRCVASCPENPCAAGQDCVEGACRPASCQAGFACAEGFDCAPAEGPADPSVCLPNDPNGGVQSRAADAAFRQCVEALTHGCVPRRCDAGYTCPLLHECRPDAPGLGCVPLPCATDADCGCGFCVVTRTCETHADGSFSCTRAPACQPTLSGCTVYLP